MKHLIYTLGLVCMLVSTSPVSAQYWTNLGEVKGGTAESPRPNLHQYQSFELDWQGFTQQLAETPMEHNSADEYLTVKLPVRDGQLESFAIVEYYALHPQLAAKYPDVHTYRGIGIDNPTTTIRLTNSQFGIHAAIFALDGSVFIETINQTDRTDYAVFKKTDGVLQGFENGLTCGTVDPPREEEDIATPEQIQRMVGEDLLTYRIAIASTPLFTATAGGVSAVVANMANAINTVNGILERDVSIRMQLIANNDVLIFSGANNPYTNQGNVIETAGENPGVFGPLIGVGSYDIGHALTEYTNGFAAGVGGFGAICLNGSNPYPGFNNKANGCSAYEGQSWSQFYSGTLAHEWGHQLSGHHNFNTDGADCGNARDPNGRREPGGGSTIMCYPGLCGSDNIQTFTDDYYHAGNISDIVTLTRNSTGSSCVFSTTATNNLPPVVNGGVTGLVLPKSTPFILTGSATDPDGDGLTYCWEQMDQGPGGSPNSPSGNAPIFRSFNPVTTPDRTFPRLNNILNNFNSAGEIMASYGRDLNFRLTARDNLGGMAFDDVSFEVTDDAGPFVVTYPSGSGSQTITAGNLELVTWDVANTTQQPVNAQIVNILFSSDEGLTFSDTLAKNVPNDGEEYVVFPDLAISTCRVKIEAADHIFFNISKPNNFTLELPTSAGFTLVQDGDTPSICAEAMTTVNVLTSALLGFSDSIDISFPSLPAGLTASTDFSSFVAGDDIEVTFSGDGTTPFGFYDIDLVATPDGGTADTFALQLEIIDPSLSPGSVVALAPTGAINISPTANFSWAQTTNASSYTFELATSPSFGASIVHSVSGLMDTQYALPFDLDNLTNYYWRVQGESVCGAGPYSAVSAFQTGECTLQEPTDLPLTMPVFGQPAITTSSIVGTTLGTISSVEIQNLKGTHEGMGEIEASLISPAGTEVVLFNVGDLCDTASNTLDAFDIDFSTFGAASLACPPNDGQSYLPVGDLSQFVGEAATGFWSLQITDQTNFNGGDLLDWDLVICTSLAESPEVITNLPLTLNRWNLATIEQTLLEASSASFGPTDVVFTLVETPDEGGLKLSGTTVSAGGTFTQDDINNGNISYLHYGDTIEQDAFVFDVRNTAGGWIGTFTFNINVTITTSLEPIIPAESLKIYPNPASNLVWVEIDQDQASTITDIELLTVHGQMINQKELLAGSTKVQFPVDQLAAGLYFVKINTAKGSQLEKLLIE